MDYWLLIKPNRACINQISVEKVIMDQRCAVILGLGVTGVSTAKYLAKKGFCLWLTDDGLQNALLRSEVVALQDVAGVEFLEPMALQERCVRYPYAISFLVASPGIPLSHPLLALSRTLGIDVFCDIELGLREVQRSTLPLIGITGTNGKTTTTMLVDHMLSAAGHNPQAVGNIGRPFLDEVELAKKEMRPLIVELSSFQLETMKTQALRSAAILNITPNHLNHHSSMEDYATQKKRIGSCLRPQGALFVHERVFQEQSFDGYTGPLFQYGFSEASHIRSDGTNIIHFGKNEGRLPATLQGLFSHDVENFLAAYALARNFGIEPEICIEAFISFKKPPHRIQFVRELDGIKFYDDSKGTNIDAVVRAVESIDGKIILIAGGVHKGESYSAWISPFKERVKMVFAIGQAASLISQDLSAILPVEIVPTLEEAILFSHKIAKSGETVLLSPGCSSFDMFKSYKERGERFQAAVWGLVEKIQ